MPSYEVIKPCYTPFGAGKLRHRAAGKVVTLTVEEAQELDGYVRLIGDQDDQETVQKLDSADTEVAAEWTMDEEVVQGVGDPNADHE